MGATFRSTIVLKDVSFGVDVEYVPGIYVPAKLSGHPDSWAPEEGEPPEILAVRAVLESGKVGKDVLKKLDTAAVDRLVNEAWYAGEAAREDPRDEFDEPEPYDD